ncbi:anti-sigma factor [uncultured Microbacterium sp.]|uniref:anti-sigma factor n=1 Tax=uncultured Microbacterium sp. TaxID=191216 RepID=UPI0026328DAC|nr:anti-sigma factor [uncultured Microbacterium sp.]
MNEQEFAELSAGHALSALSSADERAYTAALAAHPEWVAIAEADRRAAAALADGAEEVAPPLAARSQILNRIRQASGEESSAPEQADVPAASAPSTEVVQTVARRNWSRGLFALVASMVLLVGIGWGAGSISEILNRTPAENTLIQIEAAPDAAQASGDLVDGGTATVHWSESLGQVVLVSQGLPQIPDDRTFELWYVRGDGAISAGTFDAGDGRTTAALASGMEAGDTIAVTIEPAGGAPEGAPTTEPIVLIPTTGV